MAEYIERDAIIGKAIDEKCFVFSTQDVVRDEFVVKTCYKNLAEVVYSIPIADVAPVVHGRWMHLGGDEWCCSACGFVITTEGSWDKPTKKYCEDCGAMMDGGRKDGGDG